MFTSFLHKSKLTPWAKGRALPWLIVQVDLLMYCFQASEPASLPPPVSFYPPKAPPISAPEFPMLTLTIPQSDPNGPTHLKTLAIFWVNKLLLKPWGTLLLILIASSRVLNLVTKRMGQKYSSWIIGESFCTSTIVGST